MLGCHVAHLVACLDLHYVQLVPCADARRDEVVAPAQSPVSCAYSMAFEDPRVVEETTHGTLNIMASTGRLAQCGPLVLEMPLEGSNGMSQTARHCMSPAPVRVRISYL